MGYLDRRAQDVLVRLPANAAYGTSYTVTATLRNAPPNDPPIDNQVRITVRAARQTYLPMQNAE
jgi:hypothetical protein